MFSFLFTFMFMAAIFWGVKSLMSDTKPSPAITSSQIAFRSFMDEEKQRHRKQNLKAKRRENTPRFHRRAAIAFLPYGLVCLAPVLLTALILQDPIAVGLMILGCGLIGGAVFRWFNRQERIAYNEQIDNDGYVNESIAQLDAFVIPEDWTRKYRQGE